MKVIENVSRRKFLKQFGIGSGALVLAVNFPEISFMPKALASGAATKFEPSVYVHINSDNTVGIVVHRSEMGQGIRTSIPMIVADELEADWQQVQVIQGLGDKKYGSQNTDGSRSVRRFYQPLREAGATARTMLEQAAASQWQVPANECYAKENHIIHKPSGKKASFGSLVAIAATLPVPEAKTLVLKDKKDFKFIGKSNVALVDGHDIATGNTTYGFDVDLPDMEYVVIARPPVLASKLGRFDASKAKKIKGVVDVVALDNIEEPPLFKPLGGVAIIATNSWAAMQGREALEIEWINSGHEVYNSDTYKAALAASCDKADTVLRKKGNVDKALASAEKVLAAEYYVPELIHAPMEPPAATAHYHDGIFDIWACTQTPQSAQGTVAQLLKVEPEKVNINVTLLGGGFGRKSKPDFVVEAALMSKLRGKPVKVLWTREDEIKNGYYHAVSYQKLKAGISQNNEVTAWQHNVALPTIGATFSKGANVIGSEANLGLIDMPYDIANVQCAAGKAEAHTRIGWLRSVTNINQAFAVCSFADELANQAGADPKDHLIKLIGSDRQIDLAQENAKYGNYGEELSRYPIDTARLKAVVERVAKLAKWQEKRPKGKALGIAVHRSFVSYVACIAEVSEAASGKVKVDKVWFSVDCGTAVNPERIRSQMEGAAVFGLSLTFFGELTAKDGVIEQSNFHDYPMARITDTPETIVDIVESEHPPGGVGEPGVPPVAPAITNAIFALTGKRYRELPLVKQGIV
ncbi:xanthine dehydrogenase family protein molybdopterin-binding subunit [Thalassotalea sp. M1531]|uniref:Xanthine dehydrogenase family protein molybdopterin-binding subunit n=1 Tax=Thalassotalea algicola TaxID=2716224 RepID=A0A7Y0LAD5_9GAMM|nr:molybdopterin cofactor-binding domain-containing protein [Thalassotalea algicola]NMP30909.1 xanthine dehydrogenase family protein molybdopterin-binding subunit [Thalassotalea algicola]